MNKPIIKKASNNIDKSTTYANLNKKLKDSYNTSNYESLLLFSYAMIEDRLLSMLHYLYVINRYDNNLMPNDFVDENIRPLLKYNIVADKKNIYKINNISTKLKILKMLAKSKKLESDYLNDCYTMLNYKIGINNLNDWINKVNNWLKIRNEIIHSAFNKNIFDLNDKLKMCAIEGYELANTIKKYVNKIKDNNRQLSVRTKWESIEKVVLNSYKLDLFNVEVLNELINYGDLYENEFNIINIIENNWDDIYIIIDAIVNEKKFDNNMDFYIYIGERLFKLDALYEKFIYDLIESIQRGYFFSTSIIRYIQPAQKFNEGIIKLINLGKNLTISPSTKKRIIKFYISDIINITDKSINDFYELYSNIVESIPQNFFRLNQNIKNKKEIVSIVKNDVFELLNCDIMIFKDYDIIKDIMEYDFKYPYELTIKDYFINKIIRQIKDDELINLVKEECKLEITFFHNLYESICKLPLIEINHKHFENINFILYIIEETICGRYIFVNDIHEILKMVPDKIWDAENKLLQIILRLNFDDVFKYIPKKYFKDSKFIFKLLECADNYSQETIYNLIDSELKDNKDFLIELVQKDDSYFKFLDSKYRCDKDFIIKSFSQQKDLFPLLSTTFNSRVVVFDFLYPYIDDKLKGDVDIIKAVIKHNYWEIEKISNKYKRNKEIIDFALKEDIASFQYLYKFIDDEKYKKKLFDKYLNSLEYLDEQTKNKYSNSNECINELIRKQELLSTIIINDELKNNKEYIYNLIKNSKYVLHFNKSIKLFSDKDFMYKILNIDSSYYKYISSKLFFDKEYVSKINEIRKVDEYFFELDYGVELTLL